MFSFNCGTVRYVENKKLPVSLAREGLRHLRGVFFRLYNNVMAFYHMTKAWICTKHMPWSRKQGTVWEAASQQFRAMDFCEKRASTASCVMIQSWPQRYVCRRSFKEVHEGKSWKFIPSSATY